MDVLGGCLCLVASPNNGIEVWMMKYGVRELWTKFTLVNHGMDILYVLCLLAEDEIVLRTRRIVEDGDGEMILDEYDRVKLVVYNFKK